MKIFLIISLILANFFNPSCEAANKAFPLEADKTKLPKEMPGDLKINFSENFGMSPAYKKIAVKSGEISIEANDFVPEKKSFKKTDQIKKISNDDLTKLYRAFVENAFDTIENDERKAIVYDAPSEGIFISLNEQEYYQKSYGDNQPMSGSNLKRYQTVRKAIFDLADKYTKPAKFSAENQQVFEYDAEELSRHIKDAAPAKLADEDFTIIEDVLQKAVEEYNRKQTVEAQKIGSLSGYQRQLIPYLNVRGEKEVWINSFCSANGLDWRRNIIGVDGGGSCYFDLKINLATKQSFNLIVNGAL